MSAQMLNTGAPAVGMVPPMDAQFHAQMPGQPMPGQPMAYHVPAPAAAGQVEYPPAPQTNSDPASPHLPTAVKPTNDETRSRSGSNDSVTVVSAPATATTTATAAAPFAHFAPMQPYHGGQAYPASPMVVSGAPPAYDAAASTVSPNSGGQVTPPQTAPIMIPQQPMMMMAGGQPEPLPTAPGTPPQPQHAPQHQAPQPFMVNSAGQPQPMMLQANPAAQYAPGSTIPPPPISSMAPPQQVIQFLPQGQPGQPGAPQYAMAPLQPMMHAIPTMQALPGGFAPAAGFAPQETRLVGSVAASGPRQLIVNYLPDSVTEPEFRTLFEPFGPVEIARIIFNRTTGRTRGYGFIYFYDPTHAAAAVAGMNGMPLQGKRLKVAFADDQRDGKVNYN